MGVRISRNTHMPSKDRAKLYTLAERVKLKEDKKWIYLSPGIQCDVKFHCYTSSGIMRDPSFVGFEYYGMSL